MTKTTEQMPHAMGTEIFARIIREKTNVVMVFPSGFDGESAMSSLEGHIVEADSNIARFCIHPRFLKLLPRSGEKDFPALLPIELNFVTSGRAESGAPVLLLVRSNSRLLTVDYGQDGRPSLLEFRVEENFAARHARRHPRLEWSAEKHVDLRLGAVEKLPETLSDLRCFFESIRAGTKQQPRIVNISIGGACLMVPRHLVRQEQEMESDFLFVYSTLSSKAGGKPTVLHCRQLGIRPELGDEENVALRLQFMSELDWSKNAERLVWKDVSQAGSPSINEFFRLFPKGVNCWKKD